MDGGRHAGCLSATTDTCHSAMGGAAAQRACAARATTETGRYVQPRRAAARKGRPVLVVETASGGTPCAAAGRRSTPCAAPSATRNASQAGRHEPLNVLTLAHRQAREPLHRHPPAGRTRPVRAPRLASKIPPTHFRHTSRVQLTRMPSSVAVLCRARARGSARARSWSGWAMGNGAAATATTL